MSNTRNRNRIALIFIFVLFFIPLLAAVILSSKWVDFEPSSTVNLGTLVDPPVPLNEVLLGSAEFPGEDRLAGRWLLIHPLDSDCDAQCAEVVTNLRQIHIGTGRHQEEVTVLLLAPETLNDFEYGQLTDIYAQFVIAGDRNGQAIDVLAEANDGVQPATGTSFIADPEGNIMLRYDPGYSPQDMNKDLRKLLKWSGR